MSEEDREVVEIAEGETEEVEWEDPSMANLMADNEELVPVTRKELDDKFPGIAKYWADFAVGIEETEEAEEAPEVKEIDLNGYEYIFRHYRVDVDCDELVHYQRGTTWWTPHPKGGFTECYLQRKRDDGKDGELIGYGFALCSELDQFCYRTGRSIARGRARKMARTGFNPHIWGPFDHVSIRRNARYTPFTTVKEACNYLESKLPARFPFLED